LEYGIAVNQTAFHASIGMLVCPSETTTLGPTACSYRGNTGVGSDTHTFPEYPDSGNGIFPEGEFVMPSSVPDGLSATVAFSERLTGSGSVGMPVPERDFFALFGEPGSADGLARACKIAAHTSNTGFVYAGHSWFWSGRERTLYSHTLSPNSSIPDCIHPSEITATGMVTARSRHPGGVHVGMADGSVRFVKETLATPVWRAMGTRNGGEIGSIE
jgi:prepilin-type processing-associated H-X9-DG protein